MSSYFQGNGEVTTSELQAWLDQVNLQFLRTGFQHRIHVYIFWSSVIIGPVLLVLYFA